MPLDGHSYLVSQGWGGKGKGLRDGAISRPIAVTKKKNLAGLGKDRDEAFPFWDHLFTAAASAIKVHVDDSDDEGSTSGSSANVGKAKENKISAPPFKRTETGILSTRRPVHGISAHDTSGTSTPSSSSSEPSSSGGIKYSLMAIAKRDAARRGLYSRFFRGPVLGPDAAFEKQVRESSPKPQYDVGAGEETTVRAMMVRQLENAEEEARARKEEKKGKVLNTVAEGHETKKKSREERDERKRAKEERRKEREEKRKRKEAKKAKDKGVTEVAEVKKEKGKEKRKKTSSKGKEKASDESELNSVSTSLDEGIASSLKSKKTRSKERDPLQDESLEQKRSKKAKRRRGKDDEGDAPKKKKKRKGDDSE